MFLREKIAIGTLGISIVFLQSGLSYYASFQTLALLILIFLISIKGFKIKGLASMLLALLFFGFFLGINALSNPSLISQGQLDPTYSFFAILIFSALHLFFISLTLKQDFFFLSFFHHTSILILAILTICCAVMELEIIDFLSRESLFKQNIFLIDNWIDPIRVEDELVEVRKGNRPNGLPIDLFYGEGSFLSVVVFTCLISRKLCITISQGEIFRKVSEVKNGSAQKKGISLRLVSRFIAFTGILLLLYTQTLSGLIFAAVTLLDKKFLDSLSKILLPRNLFVVIVTFVLLALAVVASLPAYKHRITTIGQSDSFYQRFSKFTNFNMSELFFGITNADRIPEYGFVNGIIYVICISGIGGILYTVFFYSRALNLAWRNHVFLLLLAAFTGIFFQNGAIFSPSKVVLVAFLSIPLCCARSYQTFGVARAQK